MSWLIEALSRRREETVTPTETPLVFTEGGVNLFTATFRHPYPNDRSRGFCSNDGKEVHMPFSSTTIIKEEAWKIAQTLTPPRCDYERYEIHDNGQPPFILEKISRGNKPGEQWTKEEMRAVIAEIISWENPKDWDQLPELPEEPSMEETLDYLIAMGKDRYDFVVDESPLAKLIEYHG